MIVVVALALAAGAGWLWINEGDVRGIGANPSHDEIPSEDRERLREVLREEGVQ